MFYVECRRYYCSQKKRHVDKLRFMDAVADYDEAVQQLEMMCAELAKEHINERKVYFQYSSDYDKIGAVVYTGRLHECAGSLDYVEDYYDLAIKHI